MEKQGLVSIWFGNIKKRDSIGEYVDLKYNDDGDSVPSKFFIDFNIDMDEIDEDTIEKAVCKNSSSDISNLLNGCSYEEIIIPKVEKITDIKKSYNAVILIYNFEYNKEITSAGGYEYITAVNYE